MIISLIAAMGRNRVIGNNNALPWNMPADMKRFRDLTRGRPIIMGMKTFISIGRVLPDRPNIILTRDHDWQAPEGAVAAHSPQEAITIAKSHEEVMVIGGEQIFRIFLPLAQKMYLTLIDHDFEGDTRFPKFNADQWKEIERVPHEADKKNSYPYTFLTLERLLR